MNYYFLLYFSLLISLLGIVGWLVSEAKYEGRHSKLINRITFVFPFFALYAWFRLNLDFGVVLVFLTFGSLLIWLLAKYLVIPRASKESRSFFIIILAITIFRSFLYEPFQIPSSSMFPGLKIGDFLLVEKFTYGLRNPVNQKTFIPTGKPKRGDVVISANGKDIREYDLKPRETYLEEFFKDGEEVEFVLRDKGQFKVKLKKKEK